MSDVHFPILEPLDDAMKCGIFSTADGKIMIVHDQPLASELQWVEFDKAAKTVSLIHEDGKTQSLGIELDETSLKNIANGQSITLVHFAGKVLSSHQSTVMIVQDD